MEAYKVIEIKKSVFESNDREAEKLRAELKAEKTFLVNLMSSPGSGKTTLCHLMARFWDAQGGRVTLGGRDVRAYSCDSLMSNFSFVFLRTFLFSDTIANNIRFGKPDASMEEVQAAAKKARCFVFIMALSDGFDTVIGEAGSSLSGGERQRISIARAFMKDAPIIILDEATANMDKGSSQKILSQLLRTDGLTVISSEHKVSPEILPLYDTILELKDTHLEERT